MIKSIFAFCLFLVSIALIPVSARAAIPFVERVEPPAFETSMVVGMGGPVGLLFLDTKVPATSRPFVGFVAQRFRFPRYSLVGIEANATLLSGIGASLLLEVFHTESFRLHLDPGVHRNIGAPVSNQRFARDWDLTIGLGAELKVAERLNVTLDYRAFIPDPILMSEKLGTFARPMWEEAFKGGQLCLGLSAAF